MPMKQPKLIEKAIAQFDTAAAFAEEIGANPALVYQWRTGRRPVAPRWAIPIEEATNGAVTARALCPDVFTRAA